MRVLVLVALSDDDLIPQLNIFQRPDDGFVAALLSWIGVEAHGARQQVCILWQTDEPRAYGLSRDAMKWEGIDGRLAVRELDHAEEGEDEGRLAAVLLLEHDGMWWC
jgi:hypothetical protein